MSHSRVPFEGRVSVSGYLLDPEIISEEASLGRIRRHWARGARLVTFDGCRLLALPEPISIRAEHAPGLPLIGSDGSLSVARHGRSVEVHIRDLPAADLTPIVDLDQFEFYVLEPAVSAPASAPEPVIAVPRAETPDLRKKTGIGPATGPLARGLRELQRSAEAGHGGTAPPGRRGRLAELVLKSPASSILGRRHARYIAKLTERFEKKDWDSALRSAISVGNGGGALSLRLPKMRALIRGPGRQPNRAGTSVPYGPTVQGHLRSLYLNAAQQLEREGNLLLAAFVHADLLANPLAAVELLERNGETTSAAELAEGWKLDPGLVVRLWWQAGNRDRAVRLARARGAFATAIERLGRVDPRAATALRREWVAERQDAGDHLGAVEAAWPDAALHDVVTGDIAQGIAHGGILSGTLLAYLLNRQSNDEAAAAARRLLDHNNLSLEPAREGFLRTFSKLPAADLAHDRELASLALLDTFTPDPVASPRHVLDNRRAFRKRADPLLAADLPRGPAAQPRTPPDPLNVDAREVGQVAVHDAVAVGHDTILVALGELGVQLLAHDGKVRARWDVPTHKIVIADHGTRALLAADRSGVHTLHQLDLPISKPKPLPPVRTHVLLDGYDGARIVTADDQGLHWLELANGRWRVAWNELAETRVSIHDLNRAPGTMSALFTDHEVHAWQWELPSVTLRQRGKVGEPQPQCLLATGHLGWLLPVGSSYELMWQTPMGYKTQDNVAGLSGDCVLRAMGKGYAIVQHSEDQTTLRVRPAIDTPDLAVIGIDPDGSPRARMFGQHVTVVNPAGCVVVLDSERHEVVANLRVRI